MWLLFIFKLKALRIIYIYYAFNLLQSYSFALNFTPVEYKQMNFISSIMGDAKLFKNQKKGKKHFLSIIMRTIGSLVQRICLINKGVTRTLHKIR